MNICTYLEAIQGVEIRGDEELHGVIQGDIHAAAIKKKKKTRTTPSTMTKCGGHGQEEEEKKKLNLTRKQQTQPVQSLLETA